VLENIALILSYSAVGLAILVVGFVVLDLLTPGRLGTLVMEGNRNAGALTATGLASLGLVLWFAIFFTGSGWGALDDCAVYGLVGVAAQAAGFAVLDAITPGRLVDRCFSGEHAAALRAPTLVACAMQVAVALVVAASLT
jgi:uncharacterized membrane protein YjfL (UPF0719 family)